MFVANNRLLLWRGKEKKMESIEHESLIHLNPKSERINQWD